MKSRPEPLCPSSRAKDGALLIGIVIGDAVAPVCPSVAIREEDIVGAGGDLEQRFRFSTPCAGGACHNFDGSKCALIGRLVDEAPAPEENARLPKCGIRSRCRWFSDAGPQACSVCPFVLYPVH